MRTNCKTAFMCWNTAFIRRRCSGWRKNGWKTAAKKPVKNRDLWERLQVQLDRHSVTLEWVRGHNGHAENERCDELARSQSARHGLPEDTGYEPE